MSFIRQPDGSWVELAHSGLARFRFTYEREEGEAIIVLDETRNVRLRIDPIARTITEDGPQGWRPLYDISAVIRGPALATAARATLTDGVTRVWFAEGGAGVRDGGLWREISKVDGFPGPHEWVEQSRDGDTLTLRDDPRRALARFEFSEMAVYFHEIGQAEPRLRVVLRAVDYW